MAALIENLKTIQVDQNSAYDYLIALFVFIAFIAALKIFQLLILSRLRGTTNKTQADFNNVLIQILSELKSPIYFLIALYFAIKTIATSPLVSQIVSIFFVIAIVYEFVQAADKIIDYFTGKYLEKNSGKEIGKYGTSAVRALKSTAKVTLWVVGILLILSNLGINVIPIIILFGIVGLAIALALQNVLSDVFSSFSIYFDKPFKEGDFVCIGSDMGTVQKIGFKSTRILTLHNEEIIISNKEITDTRIQNFKKLEGRLVVFTLKILYGTKAEKLEKIPGLVRKIIDDTGGVSFDSCHFRDYGDFGLSFEVAFRVHSPDHKTYIDLREKINFDIYKTFEKEKIEFASSSQTVPVKKA